MGDSTLLLDLGNQRLSVLGPDGRIGRSLRADRPGRVGVRGVDGGGGFYFAVPAWAARGTALTDDSVQVVRWDPATGQVRPVAVVQGTRTRKDRSPSREMRLPVVGYAAHDAWAVLPSGQLVVVRAGGYRIEVIASDGEVVTGPSHAHATRPVTAQDRRAFVESFLASSPMSGRGADGGMGHAPSADEARITRLVETTEFADVHPPFVPDRLVAGSDGRVWVGRSPTPGGVAPYDVFDLKGRRVAQVEFTGDRRLVAVGSRGLYVVHEGEFGLQSLERYPFPE
jgi:sugar lactone lactonase YvrE